MNDKGFEFSFGWIFAIIVGGAILVLAIYSASRFISTEQSISNTETAQNLGAILSPFETSVEESSLDVIGTGAPTRIYFNCSIESNGRKTENTFGRQEIRTSVSSSGVGQKWSEPGIANVFYNKYIFANSMLEDSKRFYVLTLPFSYPFKISDLQIIFSDNEKYCLINPTQDVKDILNSTYIPTLQFVSDQPSCMVGAKKVCFASGGGCDINVNLNQFKVSKNGADLYFEDESNGRSPLMYAAIFSDKNNYECQVQRLAKRTSELASIYIDKNVLMTNTGCSSNLGSELASLKANADIVTSSNKLSALTNSVKNLEEQNNVQTCKVF